MMSFIKLFKAPSKLFKKDVITFLIIRRHDLGILEQKLRYIAVKPTASIWKLRQKIWHLLDLPDYCDEILILKSNEDKEVPLAALCRGNDPQHPFILEVWLPDSRTQGAIATLHTLNMLTMGDNKTLAEKINSMAQNAAEETFRDGSRISYESEQEDDDSTVRAADNSLNNTLHKDHKTADLSYKISNTSVFFQMPGITNGENFACILLKIQSDLSTLTFKLSQLENKINA